MEVTKYTFKLNDLHIAPSAIAQLMGYNEEAPAEITDIVNKELEGFIESGGIEGGFIITDIKSIADDYTINIDNKIFKVGKSVWQFLKNSEKIAIFICTAGKIISDRAKQLMDSGLVLEGYCVDVIGSVIVEAAMDKIQDELKKQMTKKNLNTTNRYSPGYCDWNVAEQHQLFTFMPNNFCEVKLNSSSLMSPIKSVSGFIGIGANVKYHAYTCTICTQVNCIYSNQNQKKNVDACNSI